MKIQLAHVLVLIFSLAQGVAACSDSDPSDGTGTADTGSDGVGGGGSDMGSATLTIGDETWEFTSFICAFGHDATESDVYSFSSGSYGELEDGTRIQILADIRDASGQGRYEGEGVVYELCIQDIVNFDDPVLGWESSSADDAMAILLGIDPPSGEAVISIDGDDVTAEGFFDDRLTDEDFERVPGSLVGHCGDQSRR